MYTSSHNIVTLFVYIFVFALENPCDYSCVQDIHALSPVVNNITIQQTG